MEHFHVVMLAISLCSESEGSYNLSSALTLKVEQFVQMHVMMGLWVHVYSWDHRLSTFSMSLHVYRYDVSVNLLFKLLSVSSNSFQDTDHLAVNSKQLGETNIP